MLFPRFSKLDELKFKWTSFTPRPRTDRLRLPDLTSGEECTRYSDFEELSGVMKRSHPGRIKFLRSPNKLVPDNFAMSGSGTPSRAGLIYTDIILFPEKTSPSILMFFSPRRLGTIELVIIRYTAKDGLTLANSSSMARYPVRLTPDPPSFSDGAAPRKPCAASSRTRFF